MSTWNTITIHCPPTFTLDDLPDVLLLENVPLWEESLTDDRDGDELILILSGWSKYHADQLDEPLRKLSEIPDVWVEHSETWDDEEPGARETVYIDGAIDEELCKESRLVSTQLAERIAVVEQAGLAAHPEIRALLAALQ